MRIVVFNGSRRKRGNTQALLDLCVEEAESQGAEVERLYIGDYAISGCTGCEGCRSTWDCVIRDDFKAMVEQIDRADAVVLGSPTYWYSVTSDMKRFIDRCYSLIQLPESRSQWIAKYRDFGKKAVTLAICEQHEVSAMGNTSRLLQDFCRDIGLDVVASVEALGHFEARSVLKDDKLIRTVRKAGTFLVSEGHANSRSHP